MTPTVRTNLKATVIPRSLMRATVLGDLLKNFGVPDDAIRICQQGFAEGLIVGVTIKGIAHDGRPEDQATLIFDQLVDDDKMSFDLSGGRSMIEALSVKLAHAVSYSVATMRRKGLRLRFTYHFAMGVSAQSPTFENACSRFNLTPVNESLNDNLGSNMRQVFEIRPGRDKGIAYSHATAHRVR